MDSALVVVTFGTAASVACALYYSVLAWRAWWMGRTVPTARDGVAIADRMSRNGFAWPKVCVVVPAHNEERMIGGLVRSLAAQRYRGDLRFVLALDRCTDGTAAAARAAMSDAAPRFEVVEISACPDGWAGKVHAVHAGVTTSEAARDASVVVFLDADTELDPRCIESAVALMEARSVDLVSLMCTLTSDTWWERVVQPAAGIELVRRFPLDRLNRAGGRIPFANGQFMAFRREAYDEIGGHAAVRSELLEDLALAAKIVHHKRDRSLAVLMADGMVRCRMYETLTEFRRGWKRIFGESFRRDADRLRAASWRVVVTGVAFPVSAAATVVIGLLVAASGDSRGWTAVVSGAAGVVAVMVGLGQMYAAQGLAWWRCVTHPAGAWVTAGIEREAARDLDAGTKTEWGGMAYSREKTA